MSPLNLKLHFKKYLLIFAQASDDDFAGRAVQERIHEGVETIMVAMVHGGSLPMIAPDAPKWNARTALLGLVPKPT